MTQNPTRHPGFSRKIDTAAIGRRPAQTRSSARGFTLVELLVVITIVAVLATLSFIGVGRAMASARASNALKSLQQIALANVAYSTDNGGRIVGAGNGLDWQGESTNGMGIMGRLYPYVSGVQKSPSQLNWEDDITPTYGPLRDANVPISISSASQTWACNIYFNQSNSPGATNLTKGKRMQQLDEPGRIIYVMSGRTRVRAQDAQDASQLPLPSTPRAGIYYSFRGKSPTAFLDGHGELLAYPIKPQLFDPTYEAAP